MNLPCRLEAEHRGREPVTKVVFQIFFHAATLNAVPMSKNVASAAFISQGNFALQYSNSAWFCVCALE